MLKNKDYSRNIKLRCVVCGDTDSFKIDDNDQTINAGVYSNGDVSIENSTVVGGQNNNVSISPALKNEIEDVLRQVEELKQNVEADEQDVAEVVMDLRSELEKESPSKKLLKRGMQALKSFHGVVVEKAIEYGIDQILIQLG